MKQSKALRAIVLAFAMVLTMGLNYGNAAEPCPDNFVFVVDQSGSMYMHFAKYPQFGADPRLKMAVAKKVATDINSLVPSANHRAADWVAALELLAPVAELYAPGPYDRAKMGKALAGIKDNQEIFNRLTPLGPGLISLDPVLAKLKGSTAVVLFSDGMANLGGDPVQEAKALYSKYPNLCVHIVSVADTDEKKGKDILTAINKLNKSSIMVEALTLYSDKAALEKFVADVFCSPRKEAPKEEVFILRGIQFDFNKSDIRPEWRVVLDEGVLALKNRPNAKVIIEGHCDGIGSAAYNQKLSERRAESVYDYFVAKGISSSRLKAVGYGKDKPKASNTKPDGSDNPEGRAINRRVELKVMQ